MSKIAIPTQAFTAFITLLMLAVLGPWFYEAWQVRAINHDIYWLTTAAGRLLQGGHMGVDVYETNPPLSILIYVPVYLLTKAGMEIEHAALIYGLSLLCLCVAAVMVILRASASEMTRSGLAFAGVSLILAGTVLSTPHFGQRDQILFFGLLPLLLVQIAMTEERRITPWVQYGVLFFGAILIMLKPHYGLIPAMVLGHRMVAGRAWWRIIGNADFVILAGVSLFYGALVWLVFPDYVHNVLPDVVKLYVLEQRPIAWGMVGLLGAIGILTTALVLRLRTSAEVQRRVLWLLAASLCSLVIFVLMRRSYAYQLLPALSFYALAVAWAAFAVLRQKVDERYAMIGVLAVMVLFCIGMPHSYYPTRQQVAEMPLTQVVRKSCKGDCRFMLWSGSLRVTQLTARYSGVESGSRFPNLWFAAGLGDETLRHKYAAMMGEDLKMFKPQVVVACHENGSYMTPFSTVPEFLREWKSYRRQGQVEVDVAAYETGARPGNRSPERCDVYLRH